LLVNESISTSGFHVKKLFQILHHISDNSIFFIGTATFDRKVSSAWEKRRGGGGQHTPFSQMYNAA